MFHYIDIKPDWTTENELRFMCGLALQMGFEDILEIGCWNGRATVHFLQMGRVTVIDTFEGSNEQVHKEYFRKYGPEALYKEFEGNITNECQNYDYAWPTIMRSRSDTALDQLASEGKKFNLIFIDGSHEYEDVKSDIEKAFKLLKKPGVIFFDDLNWPDVARAVKESALDVKNYDGKLGFFMYF